MSWNTHKLFELLGDEPWAVYRFLVQRHLGLAGASARDYLKRGRADQLIEVAKSVAEGAFAQEAEPAFILRPRGPQFPEQRRSRRRTSACRRTPCLP